MLIKVWRFVTILFVVLLLGLAFAHVLERPAKMIYDAALYLTIQKTLYVAWGPPNIGGILEPAAIFATLLLAFFLRKQKRSCWLTLGAGFTLLLAFPVVFFVFVAPANEVFSAATPTSIPSNWMESRICWEMGHIIRFVLQLIALSLLQLSLFLEINN
ncbi:MAG: DUF1772 domain-containing protein [Methylovulum sp.]|nr:DUF1772 domain-containing protein [Methylovulum sp.]